MSSRLPIFTTLVLSAACAMFVGMCLYLLSVQHFALRQLDKSVRTAEIASSRFIYGTAKSVDTTKKSMVVSLRDNFGNKYLDVNVLVEDEAYIARQDLEPVGAPVFTSLSALSRGTLADITPGTRVAIDVTNKISGEFRSKLILYGNPL